MKTYSGESLNRVAFPLGGMGAGMICIEGVGSFTAVSLRHRPEIYHEPALFSALAWQGGARVLAGPVPDWKRIFPWGQEFHSSGDGNRGGKLYGLPRFAAAAFTGRFPFARVELSD